MKFYIFLFALLIAQFANLSVASPMDTTGDLELASDKLGSETAQTVIESETNDRHLVKRNGNRQSLARGHRPARLANAQVNDILSARVEPLNRLFLVLLKRFGQYFFTNINQMQFNMEYYMLHKSRFHIKKIDPLFGMRMLFNLKLGFGCCRSDVTSVLIRILLRCIPIFNKL
ncbi:hypothetical protein BKA69DRAFT_140001 [Paraphysoderma sedebokerense]|nr:hypothetical protein BKA69DRAFT_140001 [Paraphysoderma sedebokerense]